MYLWAAWTRISPGEKDKVEIMDCIGIRSFLPTYLVLGPHWLATFEFPPHVQVGSCHSAQPLHTCISCSAYDLGFVPGCHLLTISWLLAVLPHHPV